MDTATLDAVASVPAQPPSNTRRYSPRGQRVVLAEVAGAVKTLQARREESSLFDVDRVRRAEEHLSALGQEMATGRISIREAVLLQQTFLDLLAAAIEARRAHAVASVELARAAGLLPEIVQ